MRFALDDDDRLMVDSVAEFGRQEIEPNAAAWDEARVLPEALIGLLREQGLLALEVPEGEGGTGLSRVAALAVIEELARFDGSVALTVAVSNFAGAAADGLVGYARCPELAARKDGDAWVLTGKTAHAFLPNTATAIVVSDGEESFVVSGKGTGVDGSRDETLGFRAADLGGLALAGAGGSAASGGDVLAGIGAVAVGIGTAALLRARDYALQRKQFGQAIANYQAIQWKLADFATGLDAARLMVRSAEDSAAVARAVTKAAAVAVRGCSDALQIHGGYGYTREYPIERYLRDARACGLYAGGAKARAAEALRARF